MKILLYILPLVLGVHSEEVDYLLCNDTLYPNTISWVLKDVYDSSFGAVRNIAALQNIDFQNSNIADEILYQVWKGGYLQEVIFGTIYDYCFAYIKEAYIEKNNESWESWEEDIFFHHMKPLADISLKSNFTGSFSDMIKFQAKHLESDASIYARIWKQDLEDLEARENYVETEIMTNKMMEVLIDGALEKVFKSKRYRWFYDIFVYDDWTEKMEFKLIDHLKKKALFQKTEDNPLNCCDDILSFLIKYPKVFKTRKIRPLLRMTLAKKIMEMDISAKLITYINCFVKEYESSPLLLLFGIPDGHLQEKANTLKDVLSKETSKILWVKLADQVFSELEILDLDNLFYDLYLLLLKARSFLVQLDFQDKIYPSYQKLPILIKKAFYQLFQDSRTLTNLFLTVQSDSFWVKAQDAFHSLNFSSIDPSCSSFKHCLYPFLPSKHIWEGFPTAEEAFEVITTDDAIQSFRATEFFKSNKGINDKSLFQLDFGRIEPRTVIDGLKNYILNRLIPFYDDLRNKLYSLFDKGELENVDWAAIEITEEKIKNSINCIVKAL